ncbi:sulfite exporter TauE/SafE family protein [Alphaproteobacteria bacterium]|nr:sulfite exporter TauE/SafE family protein [Alphaproteobacteria bacterium]
MFNLEILILISIVFFLGGFVKGLSGIGLPSFSIAFLTMFMGIKIAIALVVMPGLFTNLWQVFGKINISKIIYRMWPLLLFMFLFSFLGTSILVENSNFLTLLLGCLLCLYGCFSLFIKKITISKKYEKILGALVGAFSGFFGGSTGTFIFPLAFYIYSLKMTKQEFLQSIALILISASFCLVFSLTGNKLWSFELFLYSSYAVIPSFIGMYFGRKLQLKLDEKLFKSIFLYMLILIGLLIINKII